MIKRGLPHHRASRASKAPRRAACILALSLAAAFKAATALEAQAAGLLDGPGDESFPRGLMALGFQRACWTAWGPSIELDAASPRLARLFSVEAVFGIVPNWDFWSREHYDAYAVRTYVRPLLLGRSSLYAAGMIGSASFAEYDGGYYAYGRCLIFGAYAGGELDLRSLGASWPITINAEGGYEYKLGYADPFGYPTFGLGLRYWLRNK